MAELRIGFYKKEEKEPLSQEEKSIAYYIYRNSPNEDYSSLIKDDNRYFVKYNFSDYRPAALQWYPFKKNFSVLEVNAEYGALTGALCDTCETVFVTEDSLFRASLICERYKNRNNLTVYAADYRNIKFEIQFDCIVFFRTLEKTSNPVDSLNYLKTLLKPNGILLLELENKFGIQYIAGKQETYSGIPFNSIANYPVLNFGRGFSKADAIELLACSDFSCWRFYYPFPDVIAPTAIYSDDAKPKINMIERLRFSYPEDSSTIVADEVQLLKDAVKNDVYPFVSNHFIIEISDSKSVLSDVCSATISPYRSRNKSFAVLIRKDGVVEKKGLFPESAQYAELLCSITSELAKRMVPVLSMQRKENSLFMDFIEADTTQMYLRKLVLTSGSQKKIFYVMNKIWENILKSSELTDHCAFETNGIDFSPILKKAYVEMVTINSFWMDNEILFFDQEVVKENYPAKYVLWRSFQMIYGMLPELENVIAKRTMFNHYGISGEMDEVFCKVENELDRTENPYSVFFKNNISFSRMSQNRKRLLGGNNGR